jgi:hypothetical protein
LASAASSNPGWGNPRRGNCAASAGLLDICKGGEQYTVTSGDTCGSISTKYNLGWDVLYALNPGLECQGGKVALTVGMKLCVSPGGWRGASWPPAHAGTEDHSEPLRGRLCAA